VHAPGTRHPRRSERQRRSIGAQRINLCAQRIEHGLHARCSAELWQWVESGHYLTTVDES
jgi:hypothetical protein